VLEAIDYEQEKRNKSILALLADGEYILYSSREDWKKSKK
jgi:hypothetical protein